MDNLDINEALQTMLKTITHRLDYNGIFYRSIGQMCNKYIMIFATEDQLKTIEKSITSEEKPFVVLTKI